MPRRDGPLPPEFWARPATAAALATCDMAVLMEDVRLARGWSQGELAGTVGYSQSWVSRVVNGQQSLTVDQTRDIAERLGIPVHLLRLGGATGNGRASGRGEDPTRRRDFGKVVAASALSLPAASTTGTAGPPGDIDEGTAPTLRAITGGQRRLDAASPARDIAKGAVAHLEMTGRTLARARGTPFVPHIAAAASEAAGFAAWLHADMGDDGSARAYYRTAVRHARHAGESLLDTYMLGSLAAFETDAEDPGLGLTLAREAQRGLDDNAHPTAVAWLACVGAMAHAGLGDADSCARELALAESSSAHPSNADPPWPWVFPFDGAKVAGYRALAGVRLRRPHEARAAFADAFEGTRPGPKQGAVLQVELAAACAEAGDVDEAFDLASAALRTGVRFRSERVIARVRRFRGRYRGPDTTCVRDLDEQLTALLTGYLRD